MVSSGTSIQSPIPPDHRLTLEARITKQQWYADVFLRASAASNLTLITPTLLHPVGEWQHLAASYDGVRFRQFVNGIQETNGLLASVPLTNGLCSIGMRANQVNFFEGAVLALRFTGRALSPSEFMNVPAIVLSTPVVNADTVQLDFELAAGLPAPFTLLEAEETTGSWHTNAAAVLTTNTPYTSYRFMAATNGPVQFYRVQSP